MIAAKIIRRVHVWTGLLLGVQVLLWMLSGVVMTWFHIDLVHGERAMFAAPPPELEAKSYAAPGGVIAQSEGAQSVTLRSFLGRPVYEVESLAGRALFDAETGKKLSPIDEAAARAVARSDFVGAGEIETVALLDDPPQEYRGPRPVWRADFNDRLKTRLYISPATGEVVSRRNAIWRLYDFFWMLHIMDYGERENFNNPLIKTASAAGLVFALSGLVMIVLKSGRQLIISDVQYLLLLGRRKKRS